MLKLKQQISDVFINFEILINQKAKLFKIQFKLLFFFYILINSTVLFSEEMEYEELIWIVNESKTIKLEISDNFHKRKIGLMNRESLENDEGMIFIYDKLEPVNIWMYNTLISLDIIYLKNNRIKKITPNVSPCFTLPCKLYPSLDPVDMVIEINSGQAKVMNLKIGDNLIFFKKDKN
tara:strand:+ start:319 stop:852 length:534 start_codon:yes stop_codon:yes gene_type:complete